MVRESTGSPFHGSIVDSADDNIIENGRRYCNGSYFMPNDEAEQTRLNIEHQMYLIVLEGQLTTAPIPTDSPSILDIGTGPGDWVVEMSQQYPDAKIVATDISVFDTALAEIDLPNVSFTLDDARAADWPYDRDTFDLIHLRGLSGAFANWSRIYEQGLTHLKPGGYIEITDMDPAGDTVTFPNANDSYLHIYTAAMQAAAREAGTPRDLRHLRASALRAAGFVDVQIVERNIPVGLWHEDPHVRTLGKMALIAFLEGLEAFALRSLTATGRWTPNSVRELCQKVQAELLSASKVMTRLRIVTARKPLSRGSRTDRRYWSET
ncbi:hypothetical protein ASPZODRAFT_129117 [Penicilliopsis zonata CBS 506.65]|uniref:Methyltransferase domain-containing protein n=1 Tax=Penicilliopsis zonata CBS 506.65 TaxID=1073090 RepID=A0A1L9SNJ9_9EURO|nr:hypothetical protein ASPZODRAFT_129117 [Penicilliopsis zonata CBS 506.65]OJJ48805.1 hypothetical protein ASPZODRAFT_129117 [Penicilliopsis zonata CBS 506.65]